MKFNVYPDGNGDKSDEITAPSPRAAVIHYLDRRGASDDPYSIDEYNLKRIIVVPLCDEAKAIGGLTSDPDGDFWAFDVEAEVVVNWSATPV